VDRPLTDKDIAELYLIMDKAFSLKVLNGSCDSVDDNQFITFFDFKLEQY
jgi:hypothetical protein